jgi:pimeloyl-ACP methyl ester carboxylesterase
VEGAPHLRQGGPAGGPLLVLLHGLGATGAVWRPLAELAEERWPGPWLAPDLGGHGRAPAAEMYSFGGYAAEVGALVARHHPAAERIVAVGHSMGGVVALTLASGWFRPHVDLAVGVGIKVVWTVAELERAASLAARPSRTFATRDEAVERYLRVSGLSGVVGADADIARDGVVEHADGWQLAHDPASLLVGAPDLDGLLAAARAPVVLAAGEHDAMCPADDLRAVDAGARSLAGLGHNAHVEDPAAVLDLVTAAAERMDWWSAG